MSPEQFDGVWSAVGKEICEIVAQDPQTQDLQVVLRDKGYLNLEQKSQFIILVDSIKNQTIAQRFGVLGTSEYEEFRKLWAMWFAGKRGRRPASPHTRDEVVEHILFGSTPDPELFLRSFLSV